MAVTEVKNPQDYPYTMTTDHRGRSTYDMRWEIDTDDVLMPAPLVAVEAQATDQGFLAPLPARWSTYSFQGATDVYAYLKGNLRLYKPNPTGKPTRWWVDGTYEPLDPGQTPTTGDTDPLLRPVVRHWDSEPYSRIVTVDKDGNPLTNAAGQEFTEPPEEQASRPVLVMSWNVADSNAVAIFNSTYAYSVNTNTITTATATWPARHVRIDAARSSPLITEGASSYYTLTVELFFNHEPWDLKAVNQGFMVKDTEVGSPTLNQLGRAVDLKGKPVPEPVLLDTDGSRLAENTIGNFINNRVRREVSYVPLGI